MIDLKGIGDKMVYNLNSFTINSIKDLANTDSSFLCQIHGIGPKTAEKLIVMAKTYFDNRKKAKNIIQSVSSKDNSFSPDTKNPGENQT